MIVFLFWTALFSLTQMLVNVVFIAFLSGCLVALGILIYQTKSEKLGLPYKRQAKVIDLAFEDWKMSKQYPELSLIRFFQPAFFAAIFVLLASEVIRWVA